MKLLGRYKIAFTCSRNEANFQKPLIYIKVYDN